MNYRLIQEKNYSKTRIVMAIYIFTFFFLGLLGETISVLLKYSGHQSLDMIEAFKLTIDLILKGAHFPTFTIVTTGIAFFIILLMIKFGNRMMLAGSTYNKLSDKEYLDPQEQMLMNIVDELLLSARIRFKPEVYIVEENYMNAFASGWTEDNSMVAITRGLLERLNREEIEAVMAHELGHIQNADVRLTLVVGILTNVMVYAVDFLYYKVFYSSNRNSKSNNALAQIGMVLLVLKIFLPIFTFLLQMYLSRTREYLADAKSVEYTGNPDAMISALQKISNSYLDGDDEHIMDNKMRTYAYIFNPAGLFSTHPSVEDRINNLRGIQ